MTQPIRVLLVGAGAVAQRHASVLGGFEDVVIAGVTDLDPGASQALARATGSRSHPSLEAALDAEAPDAAYVCVPPAAHGAPERALIAAGVPFFVEKPLAVGMAPAEELAAAVAERGLITATGYHWRHLAGMDRARELLAETPPSLVTGAWLDKVPPPAWWRRRELSGGQIVEQATHLLDCMLDLAGDVDVVHAVARPGDGRLPADADVDAATAAVLRFASGAVGTLTATPLLRAKARASVEIVADARRIEIAESGWVEDDGDGPVAREEPGNAKQLVDRAFIDAVQGRPDRVRAPYGVALRTHRVGCAIARSVVLGAPVDVDGRASR